jgi:tRNA modification GTPase
VKLVLPEVVGQTFLSAGSSGLPAASSNTGLESPANQQAGKPALQIVDVCSLSGQGIEPLKDAIKSLVWAGEIHAGMLPVTINSRHQDALNRARAATGQAAAALRHDVSLEFVALDLRLAANAVGEIVGKTTTEDLLDSIFSTFCIGK